MIIKIVNSLLSALTGLVVGLLATIGLSFLWLKVLPVVDRTGQGPGLPLVLLLILGIMSPFSFIGGLIGGLIPREGGRKTQLMYASILSFFVTIPIAIFILWYTGF